MPTGAAELALEHCPRPAERCLVGPEPRRYHRDTDLGGATFARAMPKELRKILFTEDETRQAMVEFCDQTQAIPPGVTLLKVELTGTEEAPINLAYTSGSSKNPTELQLGRDQVAAALIRFCRAQRIPIPRQSSKTLQLKDGEIALLLGVGFKNG